MILLKFLQLQVRRREALEREGLKKAYQSVFGGPAGQTVLADLCTSVKLVRNAQGSHENAAVARAFADGQQDMILQILRQLEN